MCNFSCLSPRQGRIWYYKLRDINEPLQGHQSTSGHFLVKNAIVVSLLYTGYSVWSIFVLNRIRIYIHVICRLGGPYSEKLWPWAWKYCPRLAFSGARSQFFTIRNDPKLANNMVIFFPAENWFYRSQMRLFTHATLSLNWLVCCPLRICKTSSQWVSNSDTGQKKMY